VPPPPAITSNTAAHRVDAAAGAQMECMTRDLGRRYREHILRMGFGAAALALRDRINRRGARFADIVDGPAALDHSATEQEALA
jgi:hypothetical protein